MNTCHQCGAELKAKRPGAGRPTKYCSPLCASRAQVRPPCRFDGCSKPSRKDFLCGPHYRAEHGQPERPRGAVLAECAACGETWEASYKGPGYRGQRACSYLCRYWLQYGRWPSCDIPAPSVELVAYRHCAHCGGRFPGFHLDALYCSESCKSAVQWLKRMERRGVVPRFVAGRCLTCSAPFVDRWQAQLSSRYCSDRCAQRLYKQTRRARKANVEREPVSPQYIYERDKWCCHLCGKKVKRDAVAPHPQSPTLDHVVPLSLGGAHIKANLRCAHFLCNAIKGNRGGGEQLMLIG